MNKEIKGLNDGYGDVSIVRIGGEDKLRDLVKQVLLSLGYFNIKHVLEQFFSVMVHINNKKSVSIHNNLIGTPYITMLFIKRTSNRHPPYKDGETNLTRYKNG